MCTYRVSIVEWTLSIEQCGFLSLYSAVDFNNGCMRTASSVRGIIERMMRMVRRRFVAHQTCLHQFSTSAKNVLAVDDNRMESQKSRGAYPGRMGYRDGTQRCDLVWTLVTARAFDCCICPSVIERFAQKEHQVAYANKCVQNNSNRCIQIFSAVTHTVIRRPM